MNQETATTNLQVSSSMGSMYPIVAQAAIAALAVSLVTSDQHRDQHVNLVHLPASSAPDQPHQHSENYEQPGTTFAEWGASGTNTSATLTNTTWTSTTLLMPFDSDLFVVGRLRQSGLFVTVASEIPTRLELID